MENVITYPGPPTRHIYNVGDTAVDSNGVTWYCTVAGDAKSGGNAQFVASNASSQPALSRSANPAPGMQITDTSTEASQHTFMIGPRTVTSLTFPVATFQPVTTATVMSMDIAPSASASSYSANGVAWLDVCDAPAIDASSTAVIHTTRVGMQTVTNAVGGTGFGEVSTRYFGTAAAPIPLYLSGGYAGTGNPQIILVGGITDPYLIIGDEGSDVFIGEIGATSTTATTGFLWIPYCAGAPTGTPHFSGDGAGLIFDSTNNKIWIRTPAGAWKGVVVS